MKKYVADFETTNKIDDCRVWAFSITEIGNEENTIVGQDIYDFMDHIKTLGSCEIYFHNLAFDGQFLLHNWLVNGYTHVDDSYKLKTGEFTSLISDDGTFYSLTIKLANRCIITFYDSLKKLPFPVRVISKNFGIEEIKGEIDYNKDRPYGYELDNNEINYVKNDTIIVSKALNHQFNEGLTKMTIASDALNSYKELNKEFRENFPILTDEYDQFCREAYRGGWVYVNPKYQGRILNNLLVFDVNSLYPSRMYDCLLPYGEGIYFEGGYEPDDEYPLYIIKIVTMFELKPNHLPCIQIKNNPFYIGTEYITECLEPVELVLTSIDYELFKTMYNIYMLEEICGVKFKGKQGLFKDYIDTWNKVKMDNTGEGGVPALRTIAKLMLNSLYGRFATRTHTRKKIPYLKENGVVGYKTSEEEIKEPIYTPIACFITAYARDKTIRSALSMMKGKHLDKNGNIIKNKEDYFCYADTDSLHVLANDKYNDLLDVDSKKLGWWKLESKPEKAKFLRAKTYAEVIDGKLDIKCAGMPQIVKDNISFDDFDYGFTDNLHKLKPTKTQGGVILETTPFTIKEFKKPRNKK